MLIFASDPKLIKGFEKFIVNFATCREIRSLDSDIKLYRIETLIPEVYPKAVSPMEYITYQGAYIRTITLTILE